MGNLLYPRKLRPKPQTESPNENRVYSGVRVCGYIADVEMSQDPVNLVIFKRFLRQVWFLIFFYLKMYTYIQYK